MRSEQDSRHRAVDFLQSIDQNVPGDLDLNLVFDNASSHKIPKARGAGSRAHPGFHLYFLLWVDTPCRAAGTASSVPPLNSDVRQWIDIWNENRRRYAWTKTADQIPGFIKRYWHRITQTRH